MRKSQYKKLLKCADMVVHNYLTMKDDRVMNNLCASYYFNARMNEDRINDCYEFIIKKRSE